MKGWIQRFFAKGDIQKKFYRMYIAGNYLAIFSFIGHFVYIWIFFAVGMTIPAITNIASFAIWLVSFWFNRKGKHLAALILGSFEVIANSVLCTYLIGWNTGLHYYIIALIPFIYFIPSKTNRIKNIFSVLFCLFYAGLYFLCFDKTPFYTLNPLAVQVMNYYNIALTFLTFALSAHFYSKAAADAEDALEKEFKRSESLLLNILPLSIAQRLKRMPERVIADRFESVTVLFADIVGFTKLSATQPPEEIVRYLNRIFSAFDILTEKYGLEKIKTIGDNYMLAGGLPEPDSEHALNVVRMAQDMLSVIDQVNSESNASIQVRIGVHSGPVVAGIIGSKKFIYDLWGDTVNTASRMESHGAPGRIHISEDTYRLVQNKFECESRGEIEVKSKGKMRSYFVN